MNKIIAIVFLFFLIGCSDGFDVPKGMLSPLKMQHVMWDMIQADGYISSSTDSMLKKVDGRVALYSTVLESYNLSKDDFRKNMKYYQSRPDLLKIVFDSLQQMSLRDTARVIIDTPKVDTLKVPKVVKDSVKPNIDSLKMRKLPIERMKSLRKIKPV